MLGGVGTTIVPIIGAFFLVGVSEAAKIVLPEGYPVFFALLLIIVVFIFPYVLIQLKLKGFNNRKQKWGREEVQIEKLITKKEVL